MSGEPRVESLEPGRSDGVPFIPETAPFSPEQRAWLNGFLAGVFSRGSAVGISNLKSEISDPAALTPLTVLFGSQTGTAEGLAKRAAKEAGKRGFAATVLDMASTTAGALAGCANLLVIVSTYGDGEPPDSARALHSALRTEDGGQKADLGDVRYSVCALGDTNYTHFCRCGKDFDSDLERAGAKRVTDRTDCDVEYEERFVRWLDAALSALASADCRLPIAAQAATTAAEPQSAIGNRQSEIRHDRKNPFPALLTKSQNLSGPGSAKQVQHVEFSLEGGPAYEAGDALGVVPQNCPELVSAVLGGIGCDGEEAVPAADGSSTSLRRALTENCDLGRPSPELLALLKPGHAAPLHVIDALASAAARPGAAEFVAALRKLQPRLYSISSSPKAHPGAVHLTVGAVRYEKDGRARKGACSTFLADRAAPGESRVGVFVHSNKAFRPPADAAAPMIMVGPGTGIAPFRAFIEERRAIAAPGKNWLFFGDQREATDFLYRDELLGAKADGYLARLDLAWSRDQEEKCYVQHVMAANARELFAWLESGAHFYVCGDASRMARDVDAALHQVIESAGGRSADDAAAYVQALKAARRYCRDVY